METSNPGRRNILFLQGMASHFFSDLGAAVAALGHAVHRINFNGGDAFFWRHGGAVNYTGNLEGWPDFLAAFLAKRKITDIILFGDCRPLHRAATNVANRVGIPVYVFEEGYLRPNWVTLEKGGVNAHSPLSRDPEWYCRAARNLPAWTGGVMVRNSMIRRAIDDISYVLATQLFAWRFPEYRTHRPWSSYVEYAGGARRFFRKPLARRRLKNALDALANDGRRFYVFPLQLAADSQIRHHSQFGCVKPAIKFVIRSFARFAPDDSVLIITEHPLDTSPFEWREIVRDVAAALGVSNRVLFFEGGSPERMLHECRGLVTVNSTIGYLALSFGIPVIALGDAIYNLPGLTFQGNLDRFWDEGTPPNAVTFDAFRRVVAERTQINGAFFGRQGLKLAVQGALGRLELARIAKPARVPSDGELPSYSTPLTAQSSP